MPHDRRPLGNVPAALLILVSIPMTVMSCRVLAPSLFASAGATTGSERGLRIVLRGPDPAVSAYNTRLAEQIVPRQSSLHRRVSAMVAEAASAQKTPIPWLDARLSAAATLMAQATQGDAPPPADAIAFALSQYGIVESDVKVFVARVPQSTRVDLEPLRQPVATIVRQQAPARIGIGVRDELGAFKILVVAVQAVLMDSDPISRQLALSTVTTFRFKPKAGYVSPQVFVTNTEGRVVPGQPRPDRGGYTVDIACPTEPGRMRVEIMLEGPRGPAVGANFPVWCGTSPPAELVTVLQPWSERFPESIEEAEQQLLQLVNQARERAGLKRLAPHVSAARVARAHSADMLDNRFFGHISPTTGTVADRLDRARVPFSTVAENVGAGSSAYEVHRGLMESPGHRLAILDPRVTHMGVGVAIRRDDGGVPIVYATEVFLRPWLVPSGDATGGHASAASVSPSRPLVIRFATSKDQARGCRLMGFARARAVLGNDGIQGARQRARRDLVRTAQGLGGDTVAATERTLGTTLLLEAEVLRCDDAEP